MRYISSSENSFCIASFVILKLGGKGFSDVIVCVSFLLITFVSSLGLLSVSIGSSKYIISEEYCSCISNAFFSAKALLIATSKSSCWFLISMLLREDNWAASSLASIFSYRIVSVYTLFLTEVSRVESPAKLIVVTNIEVSNLWESFIVFSTPLV